MKIRLISTICLLIGLYLIVSFSRDLWKLVQKEGQIQKADLRLEKLEDQNQELEKKAQEVQMPEFIEKEAREKLGLAKEGETVVILPENFEQALRQAQGKLELSSENASDDLPNWQKWWKLFF